MWVPSPGAEDPLEKGMATHSSTPACRTPWTEEPGWLQSDTTECTHTHTHTHTHINIGKNVCQRTHVRGAVSRSECDSIKQPLISNIFREKIF